MFGNSPIDRRRQKAPVGLYTPQRSTDNLVVDDSGPNLIETAAVVAAVVLATDAPEPEQYHASDYESGGDSGFDSGGGFDGGGGGGGD